MGEWYLINIQDLLGVDKSITYIKLVNGSFVPEYSPINMSSLLSEKYGIDKILIKSQDPYGKSYREMSSGIIIGGLESFEPLAVNIKKYKPATNEEIFEYVNHMQQVCAIVITRFDLLGNELNDAYDFYKHSLDKIKQKIKMRKVNKVTSAFKKIPSYIGYPIKDVNEKAKEGLGKRLTLLKNEKDF